MQGVQRVIPADEADAGGVLAGLCARAGKVEAGEGHGEGSQGAKRVIKVAL